MEKPSLSLLVITAVLALLVAGAFLLLLQEPPMLEVHSFPPSSSQIHPEVTSGPTAVPTILNSPESAVDTSDWKVYRNEKYGFEVKHPPYLNRQKTLLQEPFDPGLEGSIISSFSDGQTSELTVSVSERSLDKYIVRDNPGGVYYRFAQKQNQWTSSVRGEITGGEPKLLDAPVTAYGYRTGDSVCSWHGAVIPHPADNYVFELVFVMCADEGEHARLFDRAPDITAIVNTFRFPDGS